MKSQNSTSQSNKARSIKLKMFGTGLLLISFIVQNFFYGKWNKQSEDYLAVNRDYSDMSRSALLYLNLYYNTKAENPEIEKELKKQYIHAAAEKYTQGQITEITFRDIEKQEKLKLIAQLQMKSESVTDLASFLEYNAYCSEVNRFDIKGNVERVKSIGNKKDFYQNFFLLANIIGTIILLLGIKYE